MPDATPAITRHRFMDALEAGQETERWLENLVARYPESPHRNIEYKNFDQGDGTLVIFWYNRKPLGTAIAVRDEMNFTVLTLVEIPDVGEPPHDTFMENTPT